MIITLLFINPILSIARSIILSNINGKQKHDLLVNSLRKKLKY